MTSPWLGKLANLVFGPSQELVGARRCSSAVVGQLLENAYWNSRTAESKDAAKMLPHRTYAKCFSRDHTTCSSMQAWCSVERHRNKLIRRTADEPSAQAKLASPLRSASHPHVLAMEYRRPQHKFPNSKTPESRMLICQASVGPIETFHRTAWGSHSPTPRRRGGGNTISKPSMVIQ
jgi:hypothetical protein